MEGEPLRLFDEVKLTRRQAPAQSKFLMAPGVEASEPPLDKYGKPIKRTTRPLPGPGQTFFHSTANSHLPYKFAILQRLCTVPPFNTMPLRVALYSDLAAKTWQQALEGEWAGGANDPLLLAASTDGEMTPHRQASIDLHRRYPIPHGALDRLEPQMRGESLPWYGPSLEAARKAQTRQLRGADAMVRSVLAKQRPLPYQGRPLARRGDEGTGVAAQLQRMRTPVEQRRRKSP